VASWKILAEALASTTSASTNRKRPMRCGGNPSPLTATTGAELEPAGLLGPLGSSFMG
jgi:hypothetical protein